jgi:hypothetical protein
MSEANQQDLYRREEELTAQGVFQMALEECFRSGSPGEELEQFLQRLGLSLGLGEDSQGRIGLLVESKYREGFLGRPRRFHRRQLYARILRYAYWNGDPSPECAHILGLLRREIGFTDLDHDVTMEKLIDLGWAPPKRATPLVPDSCELRMIEAYNAAKAALIAESLSADPVEEEVEAKGNVEEDRPRVASISNQARRSVLDTGPRTRDPNSSRSPVQLLGAGLGLGLLIALIPISYLKGALDTSLAARAEGQSLARTPQVQPAEALSPPPSPSVEPLPPPPESTLTPGQRCLAKFASSGSSGDGLAFLESLHSFLKERGELARLEMEEQGRKERQQNNGRFSARSEANYRSFGKTGKGGGISTELLKESRLLILSVRKEEELLTTVIHSHFLALLAYMVEAKVYAKQERTYLRFVEVMKSALQEIPGLKAAGSSLVLRGIGEDLRESESEALREQGWELLRALE